MKNISLLLLMLLGIMLFFAGTVPHYHQPVIRNILMIAGTVLVFIFYLLTFRQVIRSRSVSNKRRIVWIILIICAPLAGNLIYIIFHDAQVSRQVPETNQR